jgi:hypothetical protein
MGFKKERNITGVRKYWPVIGFLMVIALAIISWFIAPSAIELMRDIIPRFTGRELNPMVMRIIFTVVLTFLFGAISAALLALLTPKPQINVREGDMLKERQEMLRKKELEKQRLRKINRELRGGK